MVILEQQKQSETGEILIEKICKCPSSRPFLSIKENKCVECYLPRHWNSTTNACEDCPDKMIYSIEAKKCTICPETAPKYENGHCVKCNSSNAEYFNFTSGNCETCSEKEYLKQ